MGSVRIVADSGCDLPPSLAAKYEITVVPLLVRFGQESIWDTDLSHEAFWQRAASSGQIPGTAAPPPGVFQETFQRLVESGHDVLCFTLPANYSGTFNTAWLAAQEFGQRVRVIDSGSISLGIGLQVLSAARQALAGLDLDALYNQAEAMRQRTSVIFLLDTLEWVRRGGRIDRLLPLIDRLARTFHVKPVLEMFNGELHLLGVTRSHRSAVQRIEDEVRSRLPVEALGTAYTRSREAAADLAGRLNAIHSAAQELAMVEAGPVFAAHTGPNALGAVVVRA